MTFFSLTNGIGFFDTVCSCHCNPGDYKAEFDSGDIDQLYTVMVWAFICE